MKRNVVAIVWVQPLGLAKEYTALNAVILLHHLTCGRVVVIRAVNDTELKAAQLRELQLALEGARSIAVTDAERLTDPSLEDLDVLNLIRGSKIKNIYSPGQIYMLRRSARGRSTRSSL